MRRSRAGARDAASVSGQGNLRTPVDARRFALAHRLPPYLFFDRSQFTTFHHARDVVRALVLVLQVVRVLPDVEPRGSPFLPSMSGLSWFGVLVIESFPPSLHAATPSLSRIVPPPAALNCSLNFAKSPNALLIASPSLPVGSPPAFGAHDLPEHRVIPVAAAVVADRGAHGFRHRVDVRASGRRATCPQARAPSRSPRSGC